ncbi:hypothetical protein HAX54_013920, partial [Datura stramonium]|nr:hypothetical protein [Datura stramonium]
MDRQASDILSRRPSPRPRLLGPLFKSEDGDDELSSLRQAITCPIRRVVTQKFRFLNILPG